jgi:hypothetical protein
VRRLGIRLWISGSAMASVALGVFLISRGNHLSAQDYNYDVIPWGFWGSFFMALPVIAGAIWLGAAVVRAAAAERQRYRAWKATLAPEQRMAVELSETAALTAAAVAWHQHHKRLDARLSASVMGQAPLNRVHAGMMDVSASMMTRSQCEQPTPSADTDPMTAASQAVIARRHPLSTAGRSAQELSGFV